ncbi:hypothetical protein SARC_07053 [Sphaeroforma arctica JP610]|uniref:Uncharacterized protein n=1 Tax=Sphaeroforma arctica JP610 TaxID=667725 RepID=A0A0L0FUU2_9EUKA|nr:hypothetical protein SARC_07053 [Sphaeroforma arctica JP610]KNC80582.1 hypothetical protein SARC_07053 [Sphaeroforma arctica JP610]|eukprot:XP_014154484.1 hypothetical protein SARC_07053 [Sphaeroforma arctica JP610]
MVDLDGGFVSLANILSNISTRKSTMCNVRRHYVAYLWHKVGIQTQTEAADRIVGVMLIGGALNELKTPPPVLVYMLALDGLKPPPVLGCVLTIDELKIPPGFGYVLGGTAGGTAGAYWLRPPAGRWKSNVDNGSRSSDGFKSKKTMRAIWPKRKTVHTQAENIKPLNMIKSAAICSLSHSREYSVIRSNHKAFTKVKNVDMTVHRSEITTFDLQSENASLIPRDL